MIPKPATYKRDKLISFYKPVPVELVSNPSDIQALTQKFPQVFKSHSQHPIAYYKGLDLGSVKQEFLLYSSNLNTPLKTVGIQKSDQFSFDGKFLTPQPQEKNTDQFDFNLQNPNVRNLIPQAIFSYSGWLNFRNINQKLWYYIDEENTVQGPFSSIEMDSWYTKGYFDKKIKISFMDCDLESFFNITELHQKSHIKLNKQYARKQSAPRILSGKQSKSKNPIITSIVIFDGPTSSQKKKAKEGDQFDFSEEGSSNKKQKQKNQQQSLDYGEQQVLQKVLYLPKDKIGKKKKKSS